MAITYLHYRWNQVSCLAIAPPAHTAQTIISGHAPWLERANLTRTLGFVTLQQATLRIYEKRLQRATGGLNMMGFVNKLNHLILLS